MEAQKKFKLKRQYKTLAWTGYLLMIAWALYIVILIIVRKHSNADWRNLAIMIPTTIGMVVPLFAALICMMYASSAQQQLFKYKKAIHTYRARRFLTKAIAYVQLDEIQKAIDAYSTTVIRPEFPLEDLTYGMIVSACYQSTDEKLHEMGVQKMAKALDYYDPAKVDLN